MSTNQTQASHAISKKAKFNLYMKVLQRIMITKPNIKAFPKSPSFLHLLPLNFSLPCRAQIPNAQLFMIHQGLQESKSWCVSFSISKELIDYDRLIVWPKMAEIKWSTSPAARRAPFSRHLHLPSCFRLQVGLKGRLSVDRNIAWSNYTVLHLSTHKMWCICILYIYIYPIYINIYGIICMKI